MAVSKTVVRISSTFEPNTVFLIIYIVPIGHQILHFFPLLFKSHSEMQ